MDFDEELNNRSNEERKMLERAKKFIQSHQSLDSDIFREYLFLFEAYQKLLKESQFVYKISDTYQMKLMVIKEELYYEIQQKKETEKILKEKINELLETQRELEVINKKLEKISSRDHLTGLYNRQEFEKVIHREWNDSIREEKPISMMMIDIDNFKAFNDNYGHIAGDHCLQKISKVIDNALNRPRDFLARFGGEEFVGRTHRCLSH